MKNLVILGGGESGVGTAILGKQKGYEVFIIDNLSNSQIEALYGIENATNVDSFAKATWRTVSYNLQVTKGTDVYTSEILASHDGTNIMVSESNIISNTNTSLFTYTFEENSGIISLRVTPVSGSISVRYYRTSIKA